MKTFKYYLVLTTLIHFSPLLSQDLIVMTDGDSLNCKISKVKEDFIYFSYVENNTVKNTLVPIYQTRTFSYNFFESNLPSKGSFKNIKAFPQLRVGVNGGWSRRTAKLSNQIPANLQGYANDLKKGHHISFDLHHFISENIGLGVLYNFSQSRNELDRVAVDLDGYLYRGKISDNIKQTFIGPSLSVRLLNRTKVNAFLANFSIGYLKYENDFEFAGQFSLKGRTMGVQWDLGYDIGISKNLALGTKLSFSSGILSKYELSSGRYRQTIELQNDERENLSQVEFSIGLRYLK